MNYRSIVFGVALACVFVGASLGQDSGKKKKKIANIAGPEIHPYAEISGGREGYELADETVNEARLYEFYQRQADYYLSSSSTSFLPAIRRTSRKGRNSKRR